MYVGKSIRRLEDARLLTGRGRFVDDIKLPGELRAVFLRSPHGAARIRSVDKDAALNMPGARLVLTGRDWCAAGLGDLPVIASVRSFDDTPMIQQARPVFATEIVRHVGDTVAMVVADSAAQAMDAAEAVAIDYEPLPAAVDLAQAVAPGAPLVHADMASNLACDWRAGDAAAVARAMASAAHVVEIELVNQRLTHLPIEPRAVIGEYDPGEDGYTLWTTSQVPHLIRRLLAQSSLKVPEHRIRVIAPDVGGGFGQKGMHYPEEAAVLRASRILERPVRWTATRSDGFMVDVHARSHRTRARAGFDGQGHVLAIEVDTLADFGAYLSTFAAIIPTSHNATMLSGLYRVPALHGRVRGVYTNTTPVDAMRGAGRTECAYVVERLIEAGARKLAIDPGEIRRRNLIQPDQFPYRTPIGPIYDSGDYPALLEKSKKLANYDGLVAERDAARQRGELAGIGWSSFIQSGGPGAMKFGRSEDRIPGWDSASLRVHSSGKVTLACGSHSHGQGHATAYRQVVADALSCALDDIEFVNGDTAKVHAGMGTYASRSITVVGGAIAHSAVRIIDKGKQLAAHLLECASADIRFAEGQFTVAGTDRSIGFAEVATAAYAGSSRLPAGFELGLEATSYFEPEDLNYPAGMHLAVARVDRETGRVSVLRYVAVDDVGRLINPMIVEGQIHGGVAQGIGQALGEIVAYDAASGQLLSGSLMDYAVPRARDLPMIETAFIETPSPRNPLGVKGAG
ncbi:MAG: xanthine dehydrogenase family protein molybdopterin-binding subunit, partial [Dongiaceae bacterium]